MAQAAPFIALGTLLLTGMSVKMQLDAADMAEEIAEQNAAYIEQEAEEAARRLREQTERESSLIRAIHASGGATGVSQEVYLLDFEDTRRREIQWIRESGHARAEIARAGGTTAWMQGMGSAYSTLFQGLGQSASWWMRAQD